MKKSVIATAATTFIVSAMLVLSVSPVTSFASGTRPLDQDEPVVMSTTGTTLKPASQAASMGIAKDKALQIALDDAGYRKDDVILPHTNKNFKDGRSIWEVEFHVGMCKFNYNIAVEDGEIISFSKVA